MHSGTRGIDLRLGYTVCRMSRLGEEAWGEWDGEHRLSPCIGVEEGESKLVDGSQMKRGRAELQTTVLGLEGPDFASPAQPNPSCSENGSWVPLLPGSLVCCYMVIPETGYQLPE